MKFQAFMVVVFVVVGIVPHAVTTPKPHWHPGEDHGTYSLDECEELFGGDGWAGDGTE
jgi:hypothetical protein